jgi:hypothetical protein
MSPWAIYGQSSMARAMVSGHMCQFHFRYADLDLKRLATVFRTHQFLSLIGLIISDNM